MDYVHIDYTEVLYNRLNELNLSTTDILWFQRLSTETKAAFMRGELGLIVRDKPLKPRMQFYVTHP